MTLVETESTWEKHGAFWIRSIQMSGDSYENLNGSLTK